MTNLEPQPKPVIGDDGELLEPDSQVDMVIYYDYAADEFPPPTLFERLRYSAINNPVVWLTILMFLVGILYVMWPASSPPDTEPGWNSPDSDARLKILLMPTGKPVPTDMPAPEPTSVPSVPLLAKSAEVQLSQVPDVIHVRWSPNQRYLALQSASNMIALLDPGQDKLVYYGTQSASNLDWSPDSRYLYINLRRLIAGHLNASLTTLFVPNLLRSSNSITLKQPPILETGIPRQLVTSSRNMTALLSSDGLFFSIVDPHQPTWTVTRTLDSPVHDLDWTLDGKWLSAVTETAIWKWLPDSAAFLVMEGHYQQASWAPNGNDIAVTEDIIQDNLHQPRVTVINTYERKQQWTRRIVPNTISTKTAGDLNVEVAWSPDGQRIATFIPGDTAIDIWSAKAGTHLARSLNHSPVTYIDWSPDSQYLAIGSAGVTIWSPLNHYDSRTPT